MTILLVGGGSGGHITPVLAVAEAIKHRHPESRLIYVLGRQDALTDVPRQHTAIDEVVSVHAGKFRRYHGEGWRQLLDIATMLKNIRDLCYFLIGIIESFFLLGKYKPDAIFIKGGFVGVPVGLAAAVRRIPYITHDSDAVPGLANRLIKRWARIHAVAMPENLYPYPPDKTVRVGVPVSKENVFVTPALQKKYRHELDIPEEAKVLCLTGGGNGSALLNSTMAGLAPGLLAKIPDLYILHITGRGKLDATKDEYQKHGAKLSRVKLVDFVTNMPTLSGAADVMITRAGANSLADFASQGKACVVIPNPILTGGHQTKNAQALLAQDAIQVVTEAKLLDPSEGLQKAIETLLSEPKQQQRLGKALHAQSLPGAAEKLADLLLSEKIKN